MVVSKKVVLESEISAVNLIVGWNSFAFLMNCKTSSLVVVQNDAISSIKRFHSIGFALPLSMIWLSEGAKANRSVYSLVGQEIAPEDIA